MKLLLDNGTPAPLRRYLGDHEIRTAAQLGWATLANGDLLDRAEEAGYEVLTTTDQSIRFQQNLAGRGIGIVVLMEARWPYVRLRTAPSGGNQSGPAWRSTGGTHTKTGTERVTTDTSEQGLERLICIALAGDPCDPPKADSLEDVRGSYGGVGWRAGSWLDYDRDQIR